MKLGYTVDIRAPVELKWERVYVSPCTEVLLRRLVAEPTLDSVSHIFVDEIHERGMNEDFLLVARAYTRPLLSSNLSRF